MRGKGMAISLAAEMLLLLFAYNVKYVNIAKLGLALDLAINNKEIWLKNSFMLMTVCVLVSPNVHL